MISRVELYKKMRKYRIPPKSLSSEELQQAVRLHEMWLRGEEGGRRAELSHIESRDVMLDGADLRAADLSFALLFDCSLCKADLRDAKLRLTSFSDCDLREADFSGADLHQVVLVGADLSGANFTGTDLSKAALHGAILDGVTWPVGFQAPRDEDRGALTQPLMISAPRIPDLPTVLPLATRETLLHLLSGSKAEETKDRLRALHEFATRSSLNQAASAIGYGDGDHTGVRSRIRTLAKALQCPLIETERQAGCRLRTNLTREGMLLAFWLQQHPHVIA